MLKSGLQKRKVVSKMRRSIYFSLLMMSSLYSLDETPWLGDVYGFKVNTEFTYDRFRYIDNALFQPAYAYNNYATDIAFSFTASPSLELEWELEMARTPYQLYGFRSSALGAKYRMLDDIDGDPISLILGFNMRAVAGRSVRDVSSPYASFMNYEAICSIGKEFTKDKEWTTRGYAIGTLGIANHGSFWDRAYIAFESRFLDSQIFKLFTCGYFGYGLNNVVDIDHFNGWGKIHHSSLDVGIGYRYCFTLWGDLGLSCAYRVLAKSYPKHAKTVELSYRLPFSLF